MARSSPGELGSARDRPLLHTENLPVVLLHQKHRFLVTIRQACRKRKQISGLRTHETGDRKLKTENRQPMSTKQADDLLQRLRTTRSEVPSNQRRLDL
jgi:hypothetical protein